ncbi:hypothetical protein VCHENC02_3785A, partial [Vibrio harveyi]
MAPREDISWSENIKIWFRPVGEALHAVKPATVIRIEALIHVLIMGSIS